VQFVENRVGEELHITVKSGKLCEGQVSSLLENAPWLYIVSLEYTVGRLTAGWCAWMYCR